MNTQSSDKMINTSLLEQAIKNSGLKKKYIAKELGLTPYGFLKKIE